MPPRCNIYTCVQFELLGSSFGLKRSLRLCYPPRLSRRIVMFRTPAYILIPRMLRPGSDGILHPVGVSSLPAQPRWARCHSPNGSSPHLLNRTNTHLNLHSHLLVVFLPPTLHGRASNTPMSTSRGSTTELDPTTAASRFVFLSFRPFECDSSFGCR